MHTTVRDVRLPSGLTIECAEQGRKECAREHKQSFQAELTQLAPTLS